MAPTPSSRAGPVTWNTIQVGQVNPAFVDDPLTIDDFVRYQGASGDVNPMHHDPEFARAAGYPGPFAVGMLQAGVMATYATDWLGPQNVRRFKVQFRELAWPRDVITYTGVVTAKREQDEERLVDVELEGRRGSVGIHVKGWATFVVRS